MKKILFTFSLLLVLNPTVAQECENLNLRIEAVSHITKIDSETETIFYNICLGDTLVLQAQSNDNNASYSWLIDDIQIDSNSRKMTKIFDKSGGYKISLIESISQCKAIDAYVATGFEPNIQIMPETAAACPDVEVSIGSNNSNDILIEQNTEFNKKWENPVCEDEFSEPKYLPDVPSGDTASYETSIQIDCFGRYEKINSIYDIDEIQINLEHSYTGDLEIRLRAPDGKEIILLDEGNGFHQCWFGMATDDDDSEENRGVGFDYGWSMNPSYNGTMKQGIGGVPLYSDNTNTTTIRDYSTSTTKYILKSDTYLPIESFDKLIGSPLNGNWTLIITDNENKDNGWIFSWGIKMNEELLPDTWSFENFVVSEGYKENPSIITNNNGSIKIKPKAGTNTYTYEVKDNFECTHTKDLTVLAAEIKANFEVMSNRVKHLDAMVEFNNLSIPNTNEIDYYWDFGNGDYSYQQNPQYNFYNIGARYVKLTVTNKEGCKDTYSRKITTEEDYKLWVPTAFSPNGDGINDYFKLILENVMDNDYSLFIYDSWGKLVFETNDINLGWDGRRKDNGIKAAGGSYTFVSQFTNKQNQIEEKVGTFFLLE
jgi:gliding motility-associated-like protein